MSESFRKAKQLAHQQGIDASKLPNIVNMSAESITENVHAINSNCPDDRMKFIFKSLINHLHDFIRETSITPDEWMVAIKFLTETGKISTDTRQEFVLFSDIFGVSALIDSINDAKPPQATESTPLGPFFTEDAHDVSNGGSIASEGKGDYLFVEGHVLDTKGNPIPNAVIDVWEADGHGFYDTQYSERVEPDCRGRLRSGEDGRYTYRAVVPGAYPIASDGPVGNLLVKLGRHSFRPAHLHIRVEAPGFETLITALFWKGDPYLTSDAVFGVRTSLIVETETVSDTKLTIARGFERETSHEYLKQDFVLATPEEFRVVKEAKLAEKKLESLQL